MPVSRASQINLRHVTPDNVEIIRRLSVHPSQVSSVAPNARTLDDASANAGSWLRAIYADDEVVGLVLIFDPMLPGAITHGPIRESDIGLWRLMIDQRFQKMGFGRRTLDLVCDTWRSEPSVNRMLSSYVPGPDGPERFYLKYGFIKTGNLRAGGSEIEITLVINR